MHSPPSSLCKSLKSHAFARSKNNVKGLAVGRRLGGDSGQWETTPQADTAWHSTLSVRLALQMRYKLCDGPSYHWL